MTINPFGPLPLCRLQRQRSRTPLPANRNGSLLLRLYSICKPLVGLTTPVMGVSDGRSSLLTMDGTTKIPFQTDVSLILPLVSLDTRAIKLMRTGPRRCMIGSKARVSSAPTTSSLTVRMFCKIALRSTTFSGHTMLVSSYLELPPCTTSYVALS